LCLAGVCFNVLVNITSTHFGKYKTTFDGVEIEYKMLFLLK